MSKKAVMLAIKENCIECMGGQVKEVKNCNLTSCKLYKYRLGKDPESGKKLTEEQRAAAAERLRKMRENKNETE